MSEPRYSKETQALQRALATECAVLYCKNHGLSVAKLKAQRFAIIQGVAIFAQPSEAKPDGLTNDLATQPVPTLLIHQDGETLKIETTEHTRRFLS